MKKYDYIIVGCGFAGSVCASELARRGDKNVLMLERRSHVGGNAYDCKDDKGILIHQYGPHIFHTDSKRVFDYLCRFTEWIDYSHEVLAKAREMEFPVPFNLNSLYSVYPSDKAAKLEKKLIVSYGAEKKIPISQLRENEDQEIRELADFVYENVFLYYTMKQWGQKPEDIDPDTTARVPVFISRDNRYFQDTYQGMPLDGYTALFEKMLDSDKIDIRLDCDAKKLLSFKEGSIFFEGDLFEGKVIYTGALDELFGYEFGALPYRTLDFEFENLPIEQFQSHGTVNYTVDMPYTRITEFKHLTGQKDKNSTSIVKEYSKAYTDKDTEIPYYAIINEENNALYKKYSDKAKNFKNLILIGRLAEYKYYNMDKIVDLALELCDTLLK